jgi:nucleotide-binding universal stress UspA family protein
MKILLPVDGSDNSTLAVREVAGRTWEPGSEVKVIHVVESPVPVTDVMGVNTEIARDAHNEAVKAGREIIRAAEAILAGATNTLQTSSEIITANPFQSAAEEIVNAAEREGSDLIVMGSRGLNTWRRLVVGSTSLAVLQHAPCTVAIVRPKRHAQAQED